MYSNVSYNSLLHMANHLQAARSQRHRMSQSLQERALTEFRRQEEKRENHSRHVAAEKQIQANLKNEERLERMRYLREIQDEEYERRLEEAHLKMEQEKLYRENVLEQEETMAHELARINSEKLRDEKIRQYLKENR